MCPFLKFKICGFLDRSRLLLKTFAKGINSFKKCQKWPRNQNHDSFGIGINTSLDWTDYGLRATWFLPLVFSHPVPSIRPKLIILPGRPEMPHLLRPERAFICGRGLASRRPTSSATVFPSCMLNVQSCVKTFLLSPENHPQNVLLFVPKCITTQYFSQPFPKPGRNLCVS